MPPTSPASPAPKRRPPALPEAPETPPHPRRRPRATRKRAKPADNAGRRDGGRASKTTAAGAEPKRRDGGRASETTATGAEPKSPDRSGAEPQSPDRSSAEILRQGSAKIRRRIRPITALRSATKPRPSRRSLVLQGHTDEILCLAALAGGKLASGSADDGIIIWRIADGTRCRTLVGHEENVNCMAPLREGSLLASGSDDLSVIIWRVADGKHLATLEGHAEGVTCLAELERDRLASGSWDNNIVIWSITHGTQLATLEEAYPTCLATLDGNRLASGSDFDTTIVIWSLRNDTELAKLEGHDKNVTCLAPLDDGRLASGSWDHTTIIWNLADGTQLARLAGHSKMLMSLAVLDGGQLLASGSWDNTIIVWNLANFTQVVKLEGHTGAVCCMTVLDCDRLASGSGDTTIRIRPVLSETSRQIAACDVSIDFEELARGYRLKNALGDLFAAAVVQFNERIGGESASDAILRQAQVFDAIAKVIDEVKEPSMIIARLAPSILDLVRDDNLLPELQRRGVSEAAIEELAPTALFRVVLDAKYADGPQLLLFFEFVAFLLVMCCYARLTTFDALGFSATWLLPDKAAEKTVALIVAFAALAYFSVREMIQMRHERSLELAKPEDPFADEPEGTLTFYALLIPRYALLAAVYAFFAPVFFGLLVVRPHGKRFESGEAFDDWLEKAFLAPILHDPLTFLGLSRSWRGDYWNIIDALTLSCTWAALVRAAAPGFRMGIDLAAMTWVLLWLNLFGFVRQLDQRLATFVMMFERIVRDIWVFLLFYMMWVFMFACVFYLRLGPAYDGEFGFHDDGPRPGPFVPRLIARPLISTQARRTRSSPCGSRSSRCCCSASRATSTPTTTLRTWTRPCSSRTSSSPSLFS